MKSLREEIPTVSNTGQCNDLPAMRATRSLPPGRRAIIRRESRSVTSSAPQSKRPWVLAFERERPQRIEPLMGWTSDDDPLVQVELSFATRDAAVDYAERQGLDFSLREETASVDEVANSFEHVVWANALTHVATQSGQSLPEGLERAMINPASVFSSPDEVISHPLLGIGQKWEILRRWAWDEYLLDVAAQEAMPAPETTSRLDEVKTAMLRLEEFVEFAFASGMEAGTISASGRQ